MRCPIFATGLCLILTMNLTGCGKVPTWGELTSQTPAPPVAAPAVTPVPSAPVQSMAPAEPTADEIIARFNALPPSEINDSAISQLTSLKEGADRVTEINADNSGVTNNAFANIAKLTNLRQLRLNGTRIDNDACQQIAKVSSLEVLSLNSTTVSDVGVAALSALHNLKHLDLTRCILTANGFNAIGSLPALESIEIRFTNLDDRGLDLICNARTLTRLVLADNPFTDRGLVALGKLDALEYLEIGTTSIKGEGLNAALKHGGFKRLVHLGIYGCPIDGHAGPAIKGMKALERLNIGGIAYLDDAGLYNTINGMKGLKWINLSQCTNLNGEALKALQGSKNMEEIRIDQCPQVGDNVIKYMKTMKNLKRVTTGGTAITERGRNELKAALPDLLIQ